MEQKPKIQYIDQFYVYGSEARQLAEKKRQPKTRLPAARPREVRTVRLDPVALVGIAAAVVLLAAMAVGALRLKNDWQDYYQMSAYVSQLKKENAQLAADYRDSYDLDDIRKKALGMGMIGRDEAQTMTVQVTLPEPVPEPTLRERLTGFLRGLFE